jgi:serine phosphatase RsbU (regulator of sigma subunit)
MSDQPAAKLLTDDHLQLLLTELGRAFDLDCPIGDETINEKVRQRLEALLKVESPNWGTPGHLSEISLQDAGVLQFYYRPHLFPDMSESLRLGHALQFDLLPRTLPANSPLQISALLESYCHLSGDLIGWHQDGDELVFWIADVSGHGVRAGLVAAVMYFMISTLDPSLRPADLVAKLNRQMVTARRTEDPQALFSTAFVVRMDAEGKGSYTSAGHPDMLIRRADDSVEPLASTGMPIGLFEDSEYRSHDLELRANDSLFLFTDGVVEVHDEAGIEFGREGLQKAVQDAPNNPEALIRTVYSSVTSHCPSHALDDDMTLLAAQCLSSG